MCSLQELLENKHMGCTFFHIHGEADEGKLDLHLYHTSDNTWVGGFLRDESTSPFGDKEISDLLYFLGRTSVIEGRFSTPYLQAGVGPQYGLSLKMAENVRMPASRRAALSGESSGPVNMQIRYRGTNGWYHNRETDKFFSRFFPTSVSSRNIRDAYSRFMQHAVEGATTLLLKGRNDERTIEIYDRSWGSHAYRHLGFCGNAALHDVERLMKDNPRVDYESVDVIYAS